MNHVFIFYKAAAITQQHIASYKGYPPSQAPNSFVMKDARDQVYKKYGVGPGGSKKSFTLVIKFQVLYS